MAEQKAPESAITDEMRASVGVEGPPSLNEVTTTGIRMFARAVGYTRPLFYDEAYAKSKGHRSLVAPPGYLGTAQYNPNATRPMGGPGAAAPGAASTAASSASTPASRFAPATCFRRWEKSSTSPSGRAGLA